MKTTFLQTCLAVFFGLLTTAAAQTFTVTRSPAVYKPGAKLDPATVLSPSQFKNTANRGYVAVEGYIDYVAGSVSKSTGLTSIKTEDDGDYHFEMQSTKKLHTKNPVDGLVCEIDPVLQLKGVAALKQINQHDPKTYRKVRVYGWLRFGTESGHAGVQTYNMGSGTISGHWEIHPVEKIESIDAGTSFKIGPSAQFASWPVAKRYKVTNANFAQKGPSNYALLVGTVKAIKASPNKSGDVDVSLVIGTNTYTATVPQYYVASFNATAQTIGFVHLPNFASINYSLKRSDNAPRTFYGLRNWTFRQGKAIPALQPIEMIK